MDIRHQHTILLGTAALIVIASIAAAHDSLVVFITVAIGALALTALGTHASPPNSRRPHQRAGRARNDV